MSERSTRRGFAARPGDAESWIKAPDVTARRADDAVAFTARLTIDVTPALRGRIKVAAFRRGITVAEMLRDLFAREFPDDPGEPS
ncbi:hypothetical protein J2D73_03970 [Acetobacter sacchari]|uniref:Plasmid segregation centromere-binding protein ParG n=1 Tax=Acetobacter sacchari TaxID=2661687 RepID=A0ABS3LST5_9PROT|nr:hypothetical protein [Acetobacter sacchari]MBO1358956.1 hypothetical protein [Acetobacter sacchari]